MLGEPERAERFNAFNTENMNLLKTRLSGVTPKSVYLEGFHRALVQDPRILLLNAPTSALDLKHQMETMRLVRELAHTKGPAVMIAVHDLVGDVESVPYVLPLEAEMK